MAVKKILVMNNGQLETAVFHYKEHPSQIRITLENGFTREYHAGDVYRCLGKMIADLPEIKFLCKGAKLNVRPSAMLSQMTSGTMAYEHTLGVRVKRKDAVHIFDYDDQNIIHDPALQEAFFFEWLASIKSPT